MSGIRKAIDETKQKVKELGAEVRSMVNSVRPDEPLLSKTRKTLGSPVRRRLNRRLEKYRRKKEK